MTAKIPRVHDQLTEMTTQARLAIIACVVYGIWQGVGILYGGRLRWSTPSYAVLLQLPGGIETWATWILASATILAAGLIARTWIIRAAGLISMSIWSAAFGIGAGIAAWNRATAGTTALPTYLLLAFLIAILIGYREPECRTDS